MSSPHLVTQPWALSATFGPSWDTSRDGTLNLPSNSWQPFPWKIFFLKVGSSWSWIHFSSSPQAFWSCDSTLSVSTQSAATTPLPPHTHPPAPFFPPWMQWWVQLRNEAQQEASFCVPRSRNVINRYLWWSCLKSVNIWKCSYFLHVTASFFLPSTCDTLLSVSHVSLCSLMFGINKFHRIRITQ